MPADTVTVFIAEDQPIFKAGLIFMLEELENVRVIGDSADGQSAVTKVLELRPDVTLMDISLPELDGISATREIKRKWPESKVLMLTTHENDHYIFACLTAGADGYCLKNTTAQQLGLAINVIRNGTVWLDPGIASRILQSVTDPEARKKKEASEKTKQLDLTKREVEVLQMMVEGLDSQEMATRLLVAADVVEGDMRNVLKKLSVGDRTAAAIKALRQGLVSQDCVTWRILRDARLKSDQLT
jgi:DNA-binding NarL/FixJ family response regulator